jgi:hypothetical protein
VSAAIRFALTGAAALAAALVAWSAGADPPDAAGRRAEIAGMSQVQRDQLRRRHEEFQRMTDAERQSIRVLHEAAEDPALRKTLLDYEKFVGRLEPWEQTDLRQLPADKRTARLEEMLAERATRDVRGAAPWLAARIMRDWVIEPEKLDETTEILADRLTLPQTERERIQALPRRDRHLVVVRYAAQKSRSSGPDSRGPRRESRWPDDPTAVAILEQLPEGKFREFMLSEEHNPDFRRSGAMSVLTRSLFSEWQAEIRTVVSPERFRAALQSLPEQQQLDAARRDPAELLPHVMNQIASTKEGPASEFAKGFSEVAKLWRDFDPWLSRGPRGPMFFRPPFEGGPRPPGFGPGRPGDDRRRGGDDRRRGDDRGPSRGFENRASPRDDRGDGPGDRSDRPAPE